MRTDAARAPTLAELRLWQLVSPSLPIGAFAYSEGLEAAVAEGWVGDEASAKAWVLGRLRSGPARLEAPIALRLRRAFLAGDDAAVARWSRTLWAFREARELREADRAIGQALARLLVSLGVDAAGPWRTSPHASHAASYALAAAAWGIDEPATAAGLLWSWLEGQVAAAVKLVPLGQTAGQRLVAEGAALIPPLVARALALADDELGALAPGAAIAAARHEALEVRLFRS
jgi:urease accessory protein